MSKNDNKSDDSQEDHVEKEREHSGILEKIFTVLSLILLGSLCAFLVRESFAPTAPPSFQIAFGQTEKRGDFQGLEVTIKNTGDDAAKAVQVKGEATGADGQPVEAEATLDWLPGDSKRKVTLIFPADANTSSPQITIAGYDEP